MARRNSASPSPPPPPPVATTPGPRAAALQKIFSEALSSTLKHNSYENFSTCFPTPAAYCPHALENAWKQLNAKLQSRCRQEFETILHERGVVEGLNQWDGRIEDARRRMNRGVQGEEPERPLHTLSPQELYAAHLSPYLEEASQTLNTRLQTKQEQNVQAMEHISAQRLEIERMVSGLESIVKDIEGSVEALGAGMGKDGAGLRAEVWEMEQEIAATR